MRILSVMIFSQQKGVVYGRERRDVSKIDEEEDSFDEDVQVESGLPQSSLAVLWLHLRVNGPSMYIRFKGGCISLSVYRMDVQHLEFWCCPSTQRKGEVVG
jgi:hypothetical protein